jgi:NAD(P)H-dependent FMN reductase
LTRREHVVEERSPLAENHLPASAANVSEPERQAELVVTVIAGSPRPGSESARIARRIQHLLQGPCKLDAVRLLDLGTSPIPEWRECFGCRTDASWTVWSPILRGLQESDGFVIVVPEWGGMVPPNLKNLFLLCDGRTELAHKPALIVAISEGVGGSYPVAELRMSSYKNTRICYLPEHIILRNVAGTLERRATNGAGAETEVRLLSTLKLLVAYTARLRPLRAQWLDYVRQYPYGM